MIDGFLTIVRSYRVGIAIKSITKHHPSNWIVIRAVNIQDHQEKSANKARILRSAAGAAITALFGEFIHSHSYIIGR